MPLAWTYLRAKAMLEAVLPERNVVNNEVSTYSNVIAVDVVLALIAVAAAVFYAKWSRVVSDDRWNLRRVVVMCSIVLLESGILVIILFSVVSSWAGDGMLSGPTSEYVVEAVVPKATAVLAFVVFVSGATAIGAIVCGRKVRPNGCDRAGGSHRDYT